jgi:hypothetical protein
MKTVKFSDFMNKTHNTAEDDFNKKFFIGLIKLAVLIFLAVTLAPTLRTIIYTIFVGIFNSINL